MDRATDASTDGSDPVRTSIAGGRDVFGKWPDKDRSNGGGDFELSRDDRSGDALRWWPPCFSSPELCLTFSLPRSTTRGGDGDGLRGVRGVRNAVRPRSSSPLLTASAVPGKRSRTRSDSGVLFRGKSVARSPTCVAGTIFTSAKRLVASNIVQHVSTNPSLRFCFVLLCCCCCFFFLLRCFAFSAMPYQ